MSSQPDTTMVDRNLLNISCVFNLAPNLEKAIYCRTRDATMVTVSTIDAMLGSFNPVYED